VAKIILRFGAALILAGVVVYQAGATPSSAAPGQKADQAAAKPESNSDDHSQASTQTKQNSQESEDKNEDEKPRHKLHFRLGTISVGAAYTHFSGGVVSPFYPYAFYPYGFFSYGALYSPFFYGPFYGPFYYPPYASGLNYSPGKGQVKVSSPGKDKSAEIYIDDAYAGTVHELKSMWLDPGAYDLSVIGADGSSFQKRIYVLSGKTLKIKAVLEPKPSPETHQ
jgi:hypothetical protein